MSILYTWTKRKRTYHEIQNLEENSYSNEDKRSSIPSSSNSTLDDKVDSSETKDETIFVPLPLPATYILVSEFDIDTGSTLRHYYPRSMKEDLSTNDQDVVSNDREAKSSDIQQNPKKFDEDFFAEKMLPEGVHARLSDWTFFCLNRNREKYPFLDGLVNRHLRNNQIQFTYNFNPSLAESETEGGKLESQEKDENKNTVENERNSSKIGRYFLYCLNVVRTVHDASVRRGAIVKAMAVCSPYPFIMSFRTVIETSLKKYFDVCIRYNNEKEKLYVAQRSILKDLYLAINSIPLGSIPFPSMLERLLLRREITARGLRDNIMTVHPNNKQWNYTTTIRLNNNTGVNRLSIDNIENSNLSSSPTINDKEDRNVDTDKLLEIPITIPLYPSLNEIGNISVETLAMKFGAHTLRIYHALLSNKRILFAGYGIPAGEVCKYVIAAVQLVAPPYNEIMRKVYPYTNLSDLSFLSVPGYIAGVTNPMFESKEDWWDLLCVLTPDDAHSVGDFRGGNISNTNSPTHKESQTIPTSAGLGSPQLSGGPGSSNEVLRRTRCYYPGERLNEDDQDRASISTSLKNSFAGRDNQSNVHAITNALVDFSLPTDLNHDNLSTKQFDHPKQKSTVRSISSTSFQNDGSDSRSSIGNLNTFSSPVRYLGLGQNEIRDEPLPRLASERKSSSQNENTSREEDYWSELSVNTLNIGSNLLGFNPTVNPTLAQEVDGYSARDDYNVKLSDVHEFDNNFIGKIMAGCQHRLGDFWCRDQFQRHTEMLLDLMYDYHLRKIPAPSTSDSIENQTQGETIERITGENVFSLEAIYNEKNQNYSEYISRNISTSSSKNNQRIKDVNRRTYKLNLHRLRAMRELPETAYIPPNPWTNIILHPLPLPKTNEKMHKSIEDDGTSKGEEERIQEISDDKVASTDKEKKRVDIIASKLEDNWHVKHENSGVDIGQLLKGHVKKLSCFSSLIDLELEEIFKDLYTYLHTEEALQGLLTLLPESNPDLCGLSIIAVGMMHESNIVRYCATMLLKRIESFSSTKPAFLSLNRFLLFAYRPNISLDGPDTN